jgi:hypothetical protein
MRLLADEVLTETKKHKIVRHLEVITMPTTDLASAGALLFALEVISIAPFVNELELLAFYYFY